MKRLNATHDEQTTHDTNEYNERIHELSCELIARIDATLQRDDIQLSRVALQSIRNALHVYIYNVINKHA